MKSIIAYFAALRLRIVDLFTTDTAELIGHMVKLEAKIEKAIEKDARKGEQLAAAAQALNAALKANDRNLNAAYKMLHQVNSLTN